MEIKELVNRTIEARKMSYSPYSNYKVGAVLITKTGKVFDGANIENAAYGPSVCAERVAVFKAINSGEKDFEILCVCGSGNEFAFPCGVCRQVLNEFCEDLDIIICNERGEYTQSTLKKLLPNSFGPKNIQ